MSEDVIVLSEKEKRIIGQRIVYLDHLFMNAIRETGYTKVTEAYLTDILGQMITLANEIGINVVTTDYPSKCHRIVQGDSNQYRVRA